MNLLSDQKHVVIYKELVRNATFSPSTLLKQLCFYFNQMSQIIGKAIHKKVKYWRSKQNAIGKKQFHLAPAFQSMD